MLELQIPSYLISNEIFHSEKNIWQLNITLASKTASNLFLPFLLLDLTISGSKLSHAAWRLTLGLKKLLWTLNHQDSLIWTVLCSASLDGSELLWASSQIIKGRLEAMAEATADYIGKKWVFLLENFYKSLEVKGLNHDYNSSLKIASFCSTGTYGSPCTW